MTITARYIEEHAVPGLRLGRHVEHDSRSLEYAAPEGPVASVLHKRLIPVFDQGNVGSCTGNAGVGVTGTAEVMAGLNPTVLTYLNESLALAVYSDAEVIDGDGPYPPNDNGSSGLSVAKVLKARGMWRAYLHALSLNAALASLQTVPVMTGVSWYSSFDAPDSSGLVSISPNADVRGGHEFEVIGVDVDNQLVRAVNSWGPTWGDAGYFSFSFATWARLLSESGDVTVPVPLSQPAPVPTPSPIPVPAPVPVSATDSDFWTDVKPWTQLKHTGVNYAMQRRTLAWAKTLGLS